MIAFIRCFILSLIFCATAQAHQVPNMTIEADFDAAGSFELKVNVDPRVILSTQPTSLPPVAAAWYLEQSPEQVKASLKKATDYLAKNLKLTFGNEALPLPKTTWQAMDGATNLALTAETTEAHLLATLKGTVPTTAQDFVLGFGAEAQVSLILLLKKSGQAEPKVQVLFPGENSRPFAIPARPNKAKEPGFSPLWLLLLSPLIYAWWRRTKR
jgi:hypothetical protein